MNNATGKQVTLTIDGATVMVPEGTLLVEAAKRIRKDIPVYCYHPKLGPAGLCRICLVEVEKMPKLQIACNTVATEGMVVHTQNAKVNEGRRAVLEFLLLNHPLDCPICDKGGECDLQDYTIAYGPGASRKLEAKDAKPKAVVLGPTIVLDEERCIVCQRCVRFDDVITAERTLVVKDRGHNDIIATATDAPYRSNFSGNVTELCPVGALTSKTYRFKSRPWDLRRTLSTCTQCSVGCRMNIDVRHGKVLRTMSASDDDAHSEGWLCDRGRYNIGFLDDPRRVTSPLLRSGSDWTHISWEDAISIWAQKIKEAIAAGSPRCVGAIGGGRLLNEEAYLLQHVFRSLGVQNLDWRAGRQREAVPSRCGTLVDLENAQTILVLGVPPSQTAPVMDLRIRKAVLRNRARLISVGDHAAGSFVPETRVGSIAEIPPEAFAVERLAVVWDGIDTSLASEIAQRVAPMAAGLSVFGFIAGEQANARGAESLGMLPRAGGLDTYEMFDAARRGNVRVLSLFGVNPLLRYVDAELAGEALEKTPFLVVSDLFMTQTAQAATLVLPARSSLEKDGFVTSMTGDILAVTAGTVPPAGTLTDEAMLLALAAELGVEVPTPGAVRAVASARIDERRSEGLFKSFKASPHPVRGGLMPRDAHVSVRVVIASSMFTGGGTLGFDASLEELRAKPAATLSERTAQVLRLTAGDTIDLVAGKRMLRGLVVRVERSVPDGTVTILDGLPVAPAGVFSSDEFVQVEKYRAEAAV